MKWKSWFRRIPPSIKIGKSVYEVIWVDQFFRDSKQMGETRFDSQKQIVINSNQSMKESVLTYWHEVCHAISHEFGVDLTEKQVVSLEKSLPFILSTDKLFVESRSDNTRKRKR